MPSASNAGQLLGRKRRPARLHMRRRHGRRSHQHHLQRQAPAALGHKPHPLGRPPHWRSRADPPQPSSPPEARPRPQIAPADTDCFRCERARRSDPAPHTRPPAPPSPAAVYPPPTPAMRPPYTATSASSISPRQNIDHAPIPQQQIRRPVRRARPASNSEMSKDHSSFHQSRPAPAPAERFTARSLSEKAPGIGSAPSMPSPSQLFPRTDLPGRQLPALRG